jgi:two-component system chemotaxis response regulator CheB
MASDNLKKIVVIGASAGGFEVLTKFFKNIHPDIPAAFLVVVHMSHTTSGEGLVHQIQRESPLHVRLAANGDEIAASTIYIAPPDFHMLIESGHILIISGPLENKYRPSIDQLFRSAAVEYKSKTIGIILSGMLDDGTSGMIAIKNTGGTLVIQDPFEAVFPDMPLSVKGNVEVDHISIIEDMSGLVEQLVEEPAKNDLPVPPALLKEVEIAQRVLVQVDDTAQVGRLSPFICPDCGGGLWQSEENNLLKFRCHTGHAFTARALLEEKSLEVEESLWVAIRVLEEKRNLMLLMAEKDKLRGGQNWQAYERRANESKAHIDRLRELILDSKHFTEANMNG